MKTLLTVIAALFPLSVACAAGSRIWQETLIPNILGYGKEGASNFGPLFVLLQENYFTKILLAVVVLVPLVFLVHYLVIGPKVFSHDGRKIYIFSLFKRLIHLVAAVAFMVLIPTGLMIVFSKYLGGGSLVVTARNLHGLATLLFMAAVLPMFIFWVRDMLPALDDIKWAFIAGGYLSKKKRDIPAGKFNAGQKAWFWVSTLGGIVMIATGAAMYAQDFDYGIAAALGLSQIDLLRVSAIIHNCLAAIVTAFFLTHAYMSLFAIRGAILSMITGYKDEDEVRHLHSSYYKKLVRNHQL